MKEESKDIALHYDTHGFCCINERPDDHPKGCCSGRGAVPLHGYMKARAKKMNLETRVRVNRSGCLDRCELGPTMVIYPEGVWYTYQTREDIDEILDRHVLRGERVKRLLIEPDQVEPPPPESEK